MLGFTTSGSAIVTAFDGDPIISTDPWLCDDAYFGSWRHDFDIPPAQREAIKSSKYLWFSHGHPDHLNPADLPDFSQSKILISDHYGGRIHKDLESAGFDVTVLKDKTWVPLSDNVSVLTIANANQDSCLLLDINGRLVINLNDAPDLGWSGYIRNTAKSFKEVYLLKLVGWSGADMANFVHEDGSRVYDSDHFKSPIAPRYQSEAVRYGANAVIPFSSFHKYQREDSAWANGIVPSLADYMTGANPDGALILPPHVMVDCETDEVTEIAPPQLPHAIISPETFGDNWSDELDPDEVKRCFAYFQKKEVLAKNLGFVALNIGGKTHTIKLDGGPADRGVTFSAPRQSFMTAIDYEIFDDLLIGNFMKTTLHGMESLYPDFSPVVAKYADNGGVQTRAQYGAYHRHYFSRDPMATLFHWAETHTESIFRRMVPDESTVFNTAKKVYWSLKR